MARRDLVTAPERDDDLVEHPRRALLRGLGVVAAAATTGAVVATAVDDDPVGDAPVLEFTFDPDGALGVDGFERWDHLVAALAEAPAGDKWIVVAADAEVPAGQWDLNGAGFRGPGADGVGLDPNGNPVVVTFADGAQLTELGRLAARGGIVLWSDSSSPVVVVDDERSYYFEDDAWVVSTAAAFFEVRVTDGTLVLFSFRTGSGLVHPSTMGRSGPARASITHTGSATLIVAMATGNNIFDDDTVAGNGVIIAAISTAAGIREPSLPRSGFVHREADPVRTLLFSAAENVAYRPGRPEHWPTKPRDLAHALDLVAARLDAAGA